MDFTVAKSALSGEVEIPGSKSHTIRAEAIATLAEGVSVIRRPLAASDTLSGLNACKMLGAKVDMKSDWVVYGTSGNLAIPDNVIDVGNSGTTLYVAIAMAALSEGCSVFTGDEQIRRRPAGPLIEALNTLGAKVESTRGNGMAPIIVRGPMKGGEVRLDGSKTSQYLTALLLCCPLAENETCIFVDNLVERPYVEMTLRWIEEQGIKVQNDDFKRFIIPPKQHYNPFDKDIPADFSSATFFLCAAAMNRAQVTLKGLDMNDTQGDKAVFEMLRRMGTKIEQTDAGLVVAGGNLNGAELDLGNTPDALPAIAAAACFAEGETRIANVAQARLKETDRISVMAQELGKMGADIEEQPDGLIIRGSKLHSARVCGHGDHRVIMSLAVAGLCLDGETVIESCDAVNVTFPTFVNLMKSIGANISCSN